MQIPLQILQELGNMLKEVLIGDIFRWYSVVLSWDKSGAHILIPRELVNI